MELQNGQVTILINRDGATIELRDAYAAVTFAKVSITTEQLSAILSRQANVECEKMHVFGLDKVGKKHENTTHIFALPADCYEKRDLAKIHEEAIKTAPEGWTPENYYGSKTSFFDEGNRKYARVTIRRWS